MPWVEFTGPFSWRVSAKRGRVVIAYEAGMILNVTRECAQADAVGFAAPEYEFTRWLEEPALVRAHLLDPGGPAASDWGSHGLRLFSVTR